VVRHHREEKQHHARAAVIFDHRRGSTVFCWLHQPDRAYSQRLRYGFGTALMAFMGGAGPKVLATVPAVISALR
jgi:hypothetical protein